MFEARIIQGQILKKIVEAMRELVTDANLECHAEQGISMQVSGGVLLFQLWRRSCGVIVTTMEPHLCVLNFLRTNATCLILPLIPFLGSAVPCSV